MAAKRYEVRHHEHHGGGLYELEITVRWDVIDRETGAVVRSFSDESSAQYDGAGWAERYGLSISEVTLSDDGTAVDVRRSDGVVERVALP